MPAPPRVEWPGDDRADWPRTLAALTRIAALSRTARLDAFLRGMCPSIALVRLPPERAPVPSAVAYDEWHELLRAELARPTPDVHRLRSVMGRGEIHLDRLRRQERITGDRTAPGRPLLPFLAGAALPLAALVASLAGAAHGCVLLQVAPFAAWGILSIAACILRPQIRRCVAGTA